jgi:hypothetical protein
MFKLGNLAAPVPVPQAPSGLLPGTNSDMPVSGEIGEKRKLELRNLLRVHTFGLDGNVTVSSEYA